MGMLGSLYLAPYQERVINLPASGLMEWENYVRLAIDLVILTEVNKEGSIPSWGY